MRTTFSDKDSDYDGIVTMSGFTPNGPLSVTAEIIEDNQLVTKDYVDSKFSKIKLTDIIPGVFGAEFFPAFSGDFEKIEGGSTIYLKETGVTPGWYTKIRVNDTGRVISGLPVVSHDFNGLSLDDVKDKPTTVSGYGITDAVIRSEWVSNKNITILEQPTEDHHAATVGYAYSKQTGTVSYITGDLLFAEEEGPIEGFLKCDGSYVSKSEFSSLYSIIGDKYSPSSINSNDLVHGRPWLDQYNYNTTQSAAISGWTNSGILPVATSGGHTLITKNRVYLIGGNTTDWTDKVFTALIDAQGVIGRWSEVIPLPEPIGGGHLIVTKNRVYLIGGAGRSNVNRCYTATIDQNGLIGNWTYITVNLPYISAGTSFITKNRVYLVGGESNGLTSEVYTCVINNDGTLGSWSPVSYGQRLPIKLGYMTSVVTNRRVYVIGGRTYDTDGLTEIGSKKVFTATFNEYGVIGDWVESKPLPGSLSWTTSLVTRSKIYVISGVDDSGSATGTIYIGTLDSSGVLTGWSKSNNILGAISWSHLVPTKSKLYLLGGFSNGSIIYVVSANFSGGLNDCSDYYTGTLTLVGDLTTFKLPDYLNGQEPGTNVFVRY